MRSIKNSISLTFVTLTAALLLVGCSTISVNQDYDPGYDFSKVKNFWIYSNFS